jgi:UDP-N-acetylglucosamine 2-epimerase (non-hydrolysing)
MSLVFVAGARPNFMKIAPILRVLASRGQGDDARLVHTGQHYDFAMSGVFFEQLGIPAPHAHLDVGSGRHGAQTGKVMAALEDYVLGLPAPPRAVVVVGDVNSTMAGALVGAKLRIPVVHVEAGLRSFDRAMPEEINRLVTDAVSDLLLVSEPAGIANLAAEGIAAERVIYTGNVMIDSLVDQLPAARALNMSARFGGGGHAVVTLHRPSNVDDVSRLRELAAFVIELATRMPTVFPVHPRTAARLKDIGLDAQLGAAPGLHVIAPLGYREFLGLVADARLVVSDSGGIQEETTYLDVPCITLRQNTERPVTITSGTNTLVGDDLGAAWAVIDALGRGEAKRAKPIDGWDGRAAERIVDALARL